MTHRKILYILALTMLTAATWPVPASAATRAQKISPLSDSLRKTRKVPSMQQREAFRSFTARHGSEWNIRYNPRTALPEALTGGRTAKYRGSSEQAAAAFFEDNKELLKVDPSALRLVLKKEFLGVTHLQYQQYWNGLPVEFAYARVHVSAAGEVAGYQARFEPDLSLNTTPAISGQAAAAAAMADLGARLKISKTELVIYPDETDGTVKLVWKVRGRGAGLWVYYINAATGAVLFKYDDLRYACAGTWATYGTSAATVYPVSPLPNYDANSMNFTEDNWVTPVALPLRDQYFWVQDYSSRTVTTSAGDYCAQRPGKVFSSTKGPYFTVTNFRGASPHWDNGGGQWRTYNGASISSTQQPPNSITIPDDWTAAGYTFAKVMPGFSGGFHVGAMDTSGSITDPDQLYVKNGASVEGAYTGTRTNAFYGASVENPNYTVDLKLDVNDADYAYNVDISSYLVLTNDPKHSIAGPGSVVWSTYTAGVYLDHSMGDANALSEANAFYHLNAIRNYFGPINVDPSGATPADLNRHVAVMVHAHGEADKVGGTCSVGDPNCGGMQNAFYDLDNDNIMIGDGQVDYNGKYHSFALDGTIIRHEYGHLVVHRIYPILNFGEFGAISEALSDYFSLSSFWKEGQTLTTLGNYVSVGEGQARDISGGGNPTGPKILSNSCTAPYTCWTGEVHDDSLFLSQTLYELRKTPYDLGYFGSGPYAGQHRADVFVFAALFYFPDDFANFRDAMLDACRQLEPYEGSACDTTMQAKIKNAFSDHGIGAAGDASDKYEVYGSSGMCRNNNGPECAAEIGSLSALTATIYPMGDVDYYSLPLSKGALTASLDLPKAAQEGTYEAYAMFLFDSDRNIVLDANGTEVIAMPDIYNSAGGACPIGGDCLTLSPSVTLNYDVPVGSRYYLVVAGAPNQYYGNSEVYSALPYTLHLDRTPAGSAQASVTASVFDSDELSFSVPYSQFDMGSAPSSATVLDPSLTGTSEMTGAEFVFERAQLRDHDYQPLIDTLTNYSTSYMQRIVGSLGTSVDYLNRNILTGHVHIKPGFAARYPGVGTVYLEIFGRNHLGHVVSMGVSNSLNLSASGVKAVAYNNLIRHEGDKAVINYSVSATGTVTIKVYTQAGSLVKSITAAANCGSTGCTGSSDWDGTNSNGAKAASGIYFVKVKGPGLDKIVKVAVVR